MKSMKQSLFILCVALAARACAQTTPTVGTATKVLVTWTAATPAGGVSSATSTTACAANTNCITGYTGSITSPTGTAVAIPICGANPTTDTATVNGASITTTVNCVSPGVTTANFLYEPGGPLYYGTWNLSLQTNEQTSAGTTLQSTASTGTAIYSPAAVTVAPAPGGVTVQFQ
jgi:hypothetical protein